jgi:hypothetical protein
MLMPHLLGEEVARRFADQELNAAVLRTLPVVLVDDGLDVGLLGARASCMVLCWADRGAWL